MRYSKLAELYELLSSTTKRLEKTKILADFLSVIDDKDRDVLYLLIGSVFPSHSEKKIGISTQLVIKAVAKATGISDSQIVNEWRKIGDLGEVAEKLIKNKKQSTLSSHVLTTEKVIENLRKLPEFEGQGTIDKKISLIVELLSSANSIEAKYIIRTLIGDLRIGIKDSTIKESLALAFFKEAEIKEAAEKIESAMNKTNDLVKTFELVKKGKIEHLDKVEIEIGKPIKVMLAQKAKTIAEGFEEVGKPAAIEYKYDGFRLLIHKKDNKITLYTRRLENVTKQFPEVVDYIDKYVDGKDFILDSEAVGFQPATKKYMPFQNISQRIKRKYDIEKIQKELPVEVNVFDVVFWNGKSYLNESFEERTKLVKKIIKQVPYKIVSAKQIITDNLEKAEKFYHQALADNQEGVMMKNLQAIYQPGSRVGTMLKIKPESRDFDLVVTGAEYGTGKRSGWLSSFIISCIDKNKNYLEVGKVSTGLKEKEEEGVTFEKLTKLLKPLITNEEGRQVTIKPKIVLSITYQEIQSSPSYSSGFALRFPRFTALRPDRNEKDIATLDDVKNEYKKQK